MIISKKLKNLPLFGPLLASIYRRLSRGEPFSHSQQYWEARYRRGGNSGAGSYRQLAVFKAKVINEFIAQQEITNAIEMGCGDGHQLGCFRIDHYTGFDVSETAIALCRRIYMDDPTKQFRLMETYQGEQAELVLSLDVIFHLIEEEVYQQYMTKLFAASSRYVIIYSSNKEAEAGEPTAPHFKHRKFTDWIARHRPDVKLMKKIPNEFPYTGDEQNGSVADFYIFS